MNPAAPGPHPHRGRIPGPTAHARAAALAGALAELGIQHITLIHPDGAREDLIARQTDLPGHLTRTPSGELHTHAPAISVRFTPHEVEWQTSNPAAAAHLLDAPSEPRP